MKSIIQKNWDECLVCGTTRCLEEHHVFKGNPNRKLSEQYGLKVRLCVMHHRGTYGIHGKYGDKFDYHLKRLAQSAFELTHSRDKFTRIFGRNYL